MVVLAVVKRRSEVVTRWVWMVVVEMRAEETRRAVYKANLGDRIPEGTIVQEVVGQPQNGGAQARWRMNRERDRVDT